MKKFLFLCVFLLALVSVEAQKVYFIYLQSDNGSPFFIKLNDKVFSSTASGYLILPNLKDSTYTFSLGRVGRTSTEPRFSIPINNQDKGFLIKEAEGRITLFNLQSLEVLNPVASEVSINNSGVQRMDAFTQLLAKAADDSSLLYAVVITKEEKKPKPVKQEEAKKEIVAETETVKPGTKEDIAVVKEETKPLPVQQNDVIAKVDTVVSSSSNAIVQNKPAEKVPVKQEEKTAIVELPTKKVPEEKQTSNIETSVANNNPVQENKKEYTRSIVTRRSESSTTEGFGLVFLDKTEIGIDTIRILIPNPKTAYKVVSAEPEKAKPEVVEQVQQPVTTSTPAITSKKDKLSCAYLGSENEFKRLRRIMAAKNSDEGMLSEAKRGFKNTCFTTEQIRNLSALFLTAEGKYSFFDIAYGHAVDSEAFVTLGSEIKDEYYSRRFKALVGN